MTVKCASPVDALTGCCACVPLSFADAIFVEPLSEFIKVVYDFAKEAREKGVHEVVFSSVRQPSSRSAMSLLSSMKVGDAAPPLLFDSPVAKRVVGASSIPAMQSEPAAGTAAGTGLARLRRKSKPAQVDVAESYLASPTGFEISVA